MRNKLIWGAFAFLLFLASGLEARAADLNYWRHPGGNALSTSTDGRDDFAINCAVTKLPVPADVSRKFREAIARGEVGTTVQIKDGDRFASMTYKGCAVWNNIEVAWGKNSHSNRDMEVITIKADNGTVVKYGRPHICNNWAIIDITPPKPKPACFVIPFNHSRTTGVIRQTSAEFQKHNGQDWPSAAQAFLNPELAYTYVLAHLNLTEVELADIQQDSCFGVHDITGFHQGVLHCEQFCVGGKYPPASFIRQYAQQTGIQLPSKEPQGSFQFPCAEAVCELSLPLRYADRFGMYCVVVEQYQVSVKGFRTAHSNFRFDLVSAEQGARSLAAGKKGVTAYLLNDSGGVRSLTGADAY